MLLYSPLELSKLCFPFLALQHSCRRKRSCTCLLLPCLCWCLYVVMPPLRRCFLISVVAVMRGMEGFVEACSLLEMVMVLAVRSARSRVATIRGRVRRGNRRCCRLVLLILCPDHLALAKPRRVGSCCRANLKTRALTISSGVPLPNVCTHAASTRSDRPCGTDCLQQVLL